MNDHLSDLNLHATTELRHGGVIVRRDVADAAGRRLSTEIFASATRRQPRRMRLQFIRDRPGALRRVRRQRLHARPSDADFAARDLSVTAIDVRALVDAPAERHEILLLLGSPVRATDEGRGVSRSMEDDYAGNCWLNEVNTLVYDVAGLLIGNAGSCICGLCVDASLEATGDEVLATDLHWTAGPWIRLDDRVDVTADHRVMTPSGPRLAGDLVAGDPVLRADGSTHVLERAALLPVGAPRLGRNLRTASGVFAAGGFLFESEQARPCARPQE